MLKLFLKDIKLNTVLFLMTGLWAPILFFYMFFRDSPRAYVMISCLMVAIIPFSILMREERFKGNVLNCSLPFQRSTIVLSKYVSAWLMILGGLLYVLAFGSVLCLFAPVSRTEFLQMLSLKTLFTILSVYTLFICFFYPLIFRFGIGQGFLITLVMLQVAGLGLTAMMGTSIGFDLRSIIDGIKGGILDSINFLVHFFGMPGFYLFLILVIILLHIISLTCSKALFARRDL